MVPCTNSILCGVGGKWAIPVAGEGCISLKTEIVIPHEPHIIFCYHASALIDHGKSNVGIYVTTILFYD